MKTYYECVYTLKYWSKNRIKERKGQWHNLRRRFLCSISVTDRIDKKEISKGKDLNNTINHLDLTFIENPTTKEYTVFSNLHGTLPRQAMWYTIK